MGQNRFDQEAKGWDENPARAELSKGIAETILSRIPVTDAMTALDYGCGTGLVALRLQPYVRRIIGMDSSANMIAVLNEKIEALGVTNAETMRGDLLTGESPDLKVDLIVTAMALHHIEEVPRLIRVFSSLLAPGGYVSLADLDAEDGSFHADKTGVYHSGFERSWIFDRLRDAGFADLIDATAFVIEKPAGEEARRYPVFMIAGRKAETDA